MVLKISTPSPISSSGSQKMAVNAKSRSNSSPAISIAMNNAEMSNIGNAPNGRLSLLGVSFFSLEVVSFVSDIAWIGFQVFELAAVGRRLSWSVEQGRVSCLEKRIGLLLRAGFT